MVALDDLEKRSLIHYLPTSPATLATAQSEKCNCCPGDRFRVFRHNQSQKSRFSPYESTVGLVERFSLLQFPQSKNIEPTFGRQLLPPGLRVRRSRSFEWLATFSQGVGTNRAEIAVKRRIGEKPRRGQRVEGAIAATSLHRPHQNLTPLVSARFRVIGQLAY
ncbi:MAG TPA: hypothetical protein V6C90_04350 [Coleofasciculaceae cyanobacterium]